MRITNDQILNFLYVFACYFSVRMRAIEKIKGTVEMFRMAAKGKYLNSSYPYRFSSFSFAN